MKRNTSILLGILLSIFLISKDFFLPTYAGKDFVTVNNKKYELINNHSRDKDVVFVMPAADVLFEYTPYTLPGVNWPKPGYLKYAYDIVQIGTDKKGNILSFICPHRTLKIDNKFLKGNVLSEVEVGKVGGKINVKNGDGIVIAENLAWKFWGDIEIDGKTISIAKEDAAFVPIKNSQNEELLIMNSIKKSTHDGVNIDEILSSYVVSGVQDDPRGLQKGLLQNVVIDAINLWKPGFVNNQTKIKWNIDLKAPQTISGKKYQKMAQDSHMGISHLH